MSWYDLKSFLCICRNSSGVLQHRPLEKALTVTSVAFYHKLTHFADKYRPYYDKTAKSCGAFFLQENVCKHTKSGTRKCFSTLNCNVFHHLQYSPAMATNNWLLFLPLQNLIAEKGLLTARKWKPALLITLPPQTVILYILFVNKLEQRLEYISESNMLYTISLFHTICISIWLLRGLNQ